MFVIKKTNNIFLVKEIHKACFPYDQFYDHEGNHYWIAYIKHNHEPIGFCIGTDIGDKTMFLSRAGILLKWRGNGLHRRLIKVRERFAKKNNFECIITYVKSNNPESFSSIIKLRYEAYEPECKYGTTNSIYFKKSLT